jgi:hypothetical protein
MTLELVNATTAISRKYSSQFWGKALELGRSYGWKPLGTHPPIIPGFRGLNEVWTCTYFTNDGQSVTAEDARSLANALERALDDIPDTGIALDWNPRCWVEDDLPEWLSPEEREMIEDGLQEHSYDVVAMHPYAFFAGDEKQHLKGFIRFCRLGSFMIL